ncbi:MAG: transcription termination factor NusA [Coriobacteriales bacterium]|nr:transcription termination factor NusA [Coriobacteriaceae bacterium]MDD6768099.1 transcription termination factor NusA [Coriobacteriaceae bacterium]
MSSDLIDALAELAKERNIDEYDVLDRLEQELAKSYQHILKLDWDARVTIDRNTGKIYVYELVGVGEEDPETGDYPDYEEHDVTPDDVSRIAAQSAKRVINEIVRDAARANIYKEYVDRKFEMITGTVLQSTPDFTIIKIADGIEAELPHFDGRRGNGVERNEKPEGEYYQHNQRIKALIVDVREPNAVGPNGRHEGSRPAIIVSRTHPDLIRRLLEIEVPEIYDGVVEVKSIAREAGARSKIAVYSREANLDPVGACVGPKGSRIRTVVSELRGERIDVIQWNEDPAVYVANALSPAKVSRVLIDEETHYATVIVPDDQLSLAIGKEGQNARLAARLTGWHIDIKSASIVSADMLQASERSFIDDEEAEEVDTRCEHVSADGIRCRNQARPGSCYCGVHAADEESLI